MFSAVDLVELRRTRPWPRRRSWRRRPRPAAPATVGVREPVVVPERRLADRRHPAVVHHVAETDPRAGRADAGVAVITPGRSCRSASSGVTCRGLRELGRDVDADRPGPTWPRSRRRCSSRSSRSGVIDLPAAELGAVRQRVDAVGALRGLQLVLQDVDRLVRVVRPALGLDRRRRRSTSPRSRSAGSGWRWPARSSPTSPWWRCSA